MIPLTAKAFLWHQEQLVLRHCSSPLENKFHSENNNNNNIYTLWLSQTKTNAALSFRLEFDPNFCCEPPVTVVVLVKVVSDTLACVDVVSFMVEVVSVGAVVDAIVLVAPAFINIVGIYMYT